MKTLSGAAQIELVRENQGCQVETIVQFLEARTPACVQLPFGGIVVSAQDRQMPRARSWLDESELHLRRLVSVMPKAAGLQFLTQFEA